MRIFGIRNPTDAQSWSDFMVPLKFELEGVRTALQPAAQQQEGDVWVPLEAFCAATDVVLKDIDGAGQLAVCDDSGGDVCILLGADDTRDVQGTTYGRLSAFDAPLGFIWTVRDDGALSVIRRSTSVHTGLGVGDRPPKIELPDVLTGQLVSADVYYSKPAVYYMWASW